MRVNIADGEGGDRVRLKEVCEWLVVGGRRGVCCWCRVGGNCGWAG